MAVTQKYTKGNDFQVELYLILRLIEKKVENL